MKLSDDKSALTIDLSSSLLAVEVEGLIIQLALLRAQMVPEVPATRPSPTEDPTRTVLGQDQPSVDAKVLTDGRLRLWLRNQGLGWLVFNFSTDQCLALRDFFNRSLGDDQPGTVTLFGNQGGNGDSFH